ncbi:MAG: two-component system nitrogen regulation sensor histidine kinase NtrY, partial [Limisphaerales bacterium]
VDSSISFDIDDLFSLDGFSLAGLLCVAVLLLNIYLIGRWFLTSWFNLDKTLAGKAVAVVLGTAFFLIIDLIWGSHAFRFLHLLWGVSFIGLYAILYIRKVQSFSFLHIIVWISFFALLSSGLLIRANIIGENEELRVYAERQSKDEDPVMEFLFEDAAEDIISDPFVRNFYRNPISGKRAADGQILGVHLGNYFDRYDININYFNGSSRKLAGGSESRFFLDSLITVNGQSASSGSLFHLNTGSDLPYIARLEIPHEQRENDLLYILFRKRIVSGNSIYPELLLEDKGFDGDVNYDFAVYRNGKLIESNGEFPYPLKWQFPRSNPEKVTLQESNVVHLLHKASEHKMIVVTRPRDSRIKPVSLFSYLFLFLLLITFLISVPATVFPSLLLGEPITKHFNSSLRGKIQSMVVVLTILSFLVIGIVTVLHFTNQYDDYHLSRLLRKVHAVEDEIEFQSISDNHEAEARITESLYPYERGIRADLNAVSEIHAMDVNIFDKTGNLIRSSQPDIFDKGLISRKMNPSAWETLYRGQASQCIQNENIGQLNYLSAYVPILSQSGEVAGYLNLPYFAKEKNLRQEISTFMVALINVYVFLLLGAGIVALLISNSITRSLSEIGEQFKKVSLGGKNEPIPWKSNDEIGLLVGEYNKMLGQLEDSADLLAQSERENAWRDMAKQVAHEIKNPLTPMRLSIQHLQRAYSVDAPNAEELTERVTRTILEQIDNLSHIASEFSNFAKMPEAKREKINLNEILDGVVNLFAENEEIKLTMQSLDEDVFIKADKNRMIRVFNNLIKNSIQAIPDDRTGVIEVEMINYSDDVEVRVIDNGSGIPEDKRARVFVPNFTTKNSGMGLGLSMSKNIVESAGGRISFVTEENVGTTFTVTIPKWRDS